MTQHIHITIVVRYLKGAVVYFFSLQVNFLKVNFASAQERNLILENSRKLTGPGTYVREDFILVVRIKRRSTEVEISERLRSGKKYLRLSGFYIVRSKRIPKPL